MNLNKLTLLALALCLCIVAAPVAAMNRPDQVKDTNPAKELKTSYEAQVGILEGGIVCHHNMFTKEIGVLNELNVNGTYKMFPILPDGTFRIELIPGNFTLYLPDGNGGQPEYSKAVIIAGRISNPQSDLLGHAASDWPVVNQSIAIS